LDWINSKTRKLYNLLKQKISLPECAHWVEPNDPEGVCGYTLGMLFDNKQQAHKAITENIGLGGLAAEATHGVRDWHVYWNWEHILEKKTPNDKGCPFSCRYVKHLPEYSVDMCPQTKDIMMRLAVISINPADDKEWALQFAENINKELTRLF
jgi:8-amino-3,8-dideoxy-alpha-D-manno-octulosonate transaminase